MGKMSDSKHFWSSWHVFELYYAIQTAFQAKFKPLNSNYMIFQSHLNWSETISAVKINEFCVGHTDTARILEDWFCIRPDVWTYYCIITHMLCVDFNKAQ